MAGREFCSYHGLTPEKVTTAKTLQAGTATRKRIASKYKMSGPEAVIEMLEERMGVQAAMAAALDEIVLTLTETDALRYESKAGEQLRGEVVAWIQVNQQVAKLGTDYLKVGLDERKVRIAEIQAQILIGVIQAVLNRLELTSQQQKLAAVVVPQELERVAIEEGQ
jgi:hypothetical protein